MKWPYSHFPLSILISLAAFVVAYVLNIPNPVLALLVGPVFYAVREVIQWRQKNWWDQRGFMWGSVYPLAPLLTFSLYWQIG